MSDKRNIHTVAEINLKARHILENGIGEVWVEGELSRVTIHGSGHWYFTLKDELASISCAMFSRDNHAVGFVPKDGIKVCLLARTSIYEANGRFQLIASKMEEAGKGTLQQQFELLKIKLEAEGLFDPAIKKSLPLLPRKIGIITSPTGAAIRDIINVLTRRFPSIQILIAPVSVQGEGSSKSITAAIEYMNSRDDLDLLIVGRGGGSLEDLWSFNEEMVARAIAASDLPIISAVGHEIDFTIADFVADLRAPTPSAAAELAVREEKELQAQLLQCKESLNRGLIIFIQEIKLRLNQAALNPVFHEPKQTVRLFHQNIHRIEEKMVNLLVQQKQVQAERLTAARLKSSHAVDRSIQQAQQLIDEHATSLKHQVRKCTSDQINKVKAIDNQLRMLNPLAVLGRGYSITRDITGSVVHSTSDIKIGDSIITVLKDGELISDVQKSE